MALLLAPISVVILLTLLILLAILIGQWLRVGPIASSAGGALLAFAGFWLLFNSASSYSPTSSASSQLSVISYLVLLGSALLLVTASALALADAARSRRWSWLAAIWLAIVVTGISAISLFTQRALVCEYSPYTYASNCAPNYQFIFWLGVVGCLAGPVVMLVYALRDVRRA